MSLETCPQWREWDPAPSLNLLSVFWLMRSIHLVCYSLVLCAPLALAQRNEVTDMPKLAFYVYKSSSGTLFVIMERWLIHSANGNLLHGWLNSYFLYVKIRRFLCLYFFVLFKKSEIGSLLYLAQLSFACLFLFFTR